MKRPLQIVVCALVLAGCAAFEGSPDRSSDPVSDLDQLAKYFSVEWMQKYDEQTDLQKKEALRDEIVNGRLAAIDLRFNLFQQELHKEGVGLNIATDVVTIGLGAAGALASGGASQIMSGVSGGVVGVKQSVDKNVFFERTMPALLGEMIAQRKVALVEIRMGLDEGVDAYPLSQALVDLEEYYQAGTITGAIAGIVQSSGQKAAEAEVILFSERTKDFFEEARQERVDAIRTKIDGLTGEQAISLERNPPVSTPEIERLIALLDQDLSRFTDQTGGIAKEILKMRLLEGPRSDEDLEKWEEAIKEVVEGS